MSPGLPSSGVHRWEILVDQTAHSNIMIGLCERSLLPSGNYIGQSNGYAYYGASNGCVRYPRTRARVEIARWMI